MHSNIIVKPRQSVRGDLVVNIRVCHRKYGAICSARLKMDINVCFSAPFLNGSSLVYHNVYLWLVKVFEFLVIKYNNYQIE